MSGHQKFIALQPIINHSLWVFYIARKDCSLYNQQRIHACLKIQIYSTSHVEHLNMTFVQYIDIYIVFLHYQAG